ncbi:MAG: hypothetical protein JXR88_11405 [Clostridia bacterium]|nr:hypothetical protein [Clostridia bacterium]
MKIKYKFSAVWVAMAFIWLLISYFLLNNYVDKVDVSVLPVILVLPVLIIVYYIAMPLINYIVIDQELIQIHKSFIIFKHKVKVSEIHHCNIMNKDFVIFTKNEDVFPIHMDWMRKEEMISIFEIISKTALIQDKEKKTVNLETFKSMI